MIVARGCMSDDFYTVCCLNFVCIRRPRNEVSSYLGAAHLHFTFAFLVRVMDESIRLYFCEVFFSVFIFG